MENRERLLEAALSLFYEKGYDAVGVQEIVEAAGVTKPTLYYYFGSKKGLLEAVLQKNFRVMEEQLIQATGPEPGGSDGFPQRLRESEIFSADAGSVLFGQEERRVSDGISFCRAVLPAVCEYF